MRRSNSGFTLIELLCVIVIISILIGLLVPNLKKYQGKADSVKCLNNLRQIGVAVNNYSADNDNHFPAIESMPTDEVYSQADNGEDPKPIYETLSPYGVTKDLLKCPTDLRTFNYFEKEGSSYQWRNIVDDEIASAPKIYGRRGVRNPRTAWLLLATDYENIHSGHGNRLYADGHVVAF
ncbi:MAG: type II secretion system protein [Chthoniobacterales bacterium]